MVPWHPDRMLLGRQRWFMGTGATYINSIALNLMVATEMCCSLEEQRNERKLVAADHLPEAQQSYKKKIILLEDSEI